jgi:hypothetical protein
MLNDDYKPRKVICAGCGKNLDERLVCKTVKDMEGCSNNPKKKPAKPNEKSGNHPYWPD